MVYEVIESFHGQNRPLFEVELPRVETVQLVLCRIGQLPMIVCGKCQRPFGDDFFFMKRTSLPNRADNLDKKRQLFGSELIRMLALFMP